MTYKIALLHYSCPPAVGGVEEIIWQQASVFKRYGHSVRLFVGSGGGFSEKCDVRVNPLLGSRNEEIRRAHQASSNDSSEKILELSGKIYRYLREHLKGFDVLIAHNVLTMPFNLPLTDALRRIGRERLMPVISWNHDSPYFYPAYPGHLDLAPWNILKRAWPGIDYVAISTNSGKLFSKLYGAGTHLDVIPDGIDPVTFFQLEPATVRLIQEEKLFESEFLMVQPSRLNPRKNIELSIRVIKTLRETGLGARLLISGAHDPHEPKCLEYYNKLINMARELGVEKDVLIIAEHVFKNGEVLSSGRLTIRDLYLIADVLFLPSLMEGFGIPLLEAGMIRLPIVCSNIPPFLEIGDQDVCLFDLGDPPEKIARKILDFVEGLKPHRMFRKVMRNFSWDTIYHRKIMPCLAKVIGNFRSSTDRAVAG